MLNILYSIVGILVPFVGTSFGSSFVFFMKKNIRPSVQKFIVGFAAGVMLAASFWSLILPSIEMAEKQGKISWIPTFWGILSGILFLLIINIIAGFFEKNNGKRNLNMLLFSVTLHNIPEGMAVGVCFAGFLSENAGIALLEAIVLAIGIAIQNIPEGAIISIPLKMRGMDKKKAFIYGALSGIVEPIAAIITIMLTNIVVPFLPFLLSFAAGAMIFVIIEELIPEMHEGKKSTLGVIGVTIGFLIMMILDVVLG